MTTSVNTTLGAISEESSITLDGSGDYAMPDNGVFTLSREVLAAAGTSAATAATISDQLCVVTGANGTKGVALPAAAVAEGPYLVINSVLTSGGDLLVYPVSGGNDNINGLSEDAAFTMGPGKAAWFVPTSATQWYVEDVAGVLTTKAEANILDGVTASAVELNLLDNAVAGTVVNSTAVVYGASGEVAAGSVTSAGAVTSGAVGGALGSVVLKGTTSGTVTATTDATATKLTVDKPIEITGGITGTSSATLGAVGGTLGSVVLKGTTSGTVTATTDATATKLTVDKPIEAALNGTVGATTPAAGAFTTITGTSSATLGEVGGGLGSVVLKGTTSGTVTATTDATATKLTVDKPIEAALNGTVGATTPAAGAFTTLTGTSSATLGAVGGALGSVVLKGTTSGTVTATTDATATKLTVDKPIEAALNGTVGATTPAAGAFTTITGASSATLGAASGTTGSLVLKGTTSGAVTLTPADAAGTYTLTLPNSDGDASQSLRSNGSGTLAWADLKPYHGVGSRTDNTIAFDYGTLTFTMAPSGGSTFDIWCQGTKYSKTSTSLVHGVGGVSFAVGMNYIYYSAAGVLTVSGSVWTDFTTVVPVATVFITALTGGAHALQDERHSATRDLAWHAWAHSTIGARYRSGLAYTSGSATPDTFTVTAGYIDDEDIAFTITPNKTSCRTWYQSAADAYTFATAASNYAFIWNGGTSRVRYPNSSSSYALTDLSDSKYTNVWVYATTDQDYPIYTFSQTFAGAAGGYNTVAQARAIAPPTLTGFGLTPELKLLYRVIFKGDGSYAEQTDYRNSSSLPAGAVASPTALAVTFSPAGGIAATNVQGALEELDTEKQATLVSGTTLKTVNSTTLLGSGDVAVQATLVSGTNIKTVGGATLLGSGDLGIIGSAYGGTGNGFTKFDGPTTSEKTFTLPDASMSIGYMNVPQVSKSEAYGLVIGDAGKHILHPSADTTARIFTIPANSSVAYPTGTAITIVNQDSAGVVTIKITDDTMRLAGAGTTGDRTLAANGIATALKVTATEWIISGTGLT